MSVEILSVERNVADEVVLNVVPTDIVDLETFIASKWNKEDEFL